MRPEMETQALQLRTISNSVDHIHRNIFCSRLLRPRLSRFRNVSRTLYVNLELSIRY
jgi:hypothetical protein